MSVHPRPQAWFAENVPTVVAFITRIKQQIDAGKRHILVKAPVKSGKRLMVEFLSVFLPTCRVKYVTSLNRKDVKSQKSELERYGVKTHLMSDADRREEAIADMRIDLSGRHLVVCCFDECDYGSGDRQIMGPFYEAFLDEPNVVKVYFSATAHETAVSDVSSRADYVAMTYEPPASYCGAPYFLANNLVFNPQPFFENEDGWVRVTEHGLNVIRESVTAERHIAVVRTTRAIPTALFKNEQVKAALAEQLAEAKQDGKVWDIRAIDDKSPFDWEDRVTRIGCTMDTETNHLFVILQTCTRGTDLKGWHHKLAFWHDRRESETVNLNTMIQAVLRPCHYSTDYAGVPQPVRLYVDRRVVQMAADDNTEAYLAAGGKAPARTRVRPTQKYALSEETFTTVEAAREWAKTKYPRVSERTNDGHCYRYRGKDRPLETEKKTRENELGEGVKAAARIIPFLRRGKVRYLVSYSIVPSDDASTSSTASSPSMTLETTRASMFESRRGGL
jgi:hypothetical protein